MQRNTIHVSKYTVTAAGPNAAVGDNEMGALTAAAAVGNRLSGQYRPRFQGWCQGVAERVNQGGPPCSGRLEGCDGKMNV